jgi:hypothetical protein
VRTAGLLGWEGIYEGEERGGKIRGTRSVKVTKGSVFIRDEETGTEC